MKTINKTYFGGTRSDYFWPSGQLTQPPTTGIVTGVNQVTPSSIVRGNFHDPNSWSYTIHQTQSFAGSYERFEWPSNYLHRTIGAFGDNSGPLWYPNYDRTLMYNRALGRLNALVRGSLDLGVDLAEGGQTIRMIRSLHRVERFARSGKWKYFKNPANGWLEWQYGWRPLLSDVWEASDSSARAARKALTHVTAKATQPIRTADKGRTYFVNTTPPSVREGFGVQGCKFVLNLTPRETDPGQWSSLNPVSLAWEVIPYSFVIDWFVDVSSYLRNLETACLYDTNFVSGYYSEIYAYQGRESVQNESNGYWQGNGKPSTTWARILDVRGKIRHIEFHRTKLTSYPFPRKPTFKVDLGSQRLLSAASLLAQLLK